MVAPQNTQYPKTNKKFDASQVAHRILSMKRQLWTT